MRSSTSFSILALLATAGTSFGAPVQYRDHATKGDELANVDAHRAVNVGVLNSHDDSKQSHSHHENKHPINLDADDLVNVEIGNHKLSKSNQHARAESVGPLPNIDKPLDAHSADNVHPVTGNKQSDILNIGPVTGDSHLKDVKVKVLPNDRPVPGKDGIVDVNQGNLGAHVLQTPGKAKTIAEVQLGDGNPTHKTNAKVNLPVDGPGGGLAGPGGSDNQAGNVVAQLLGRPGKGPKTIVGLEPIAEVGLNPNPPQPKPSKAPSPSASSHPSQAPASSHAPARPSHSSAPQHSNAPSQAAHSSSAAPSASMVAQGAPSSHPSQAPRQSASQSAGHSRPPVSHSSQAPARPPQSSGGNYSGNNGGEDDGGSLIPGAFRPSRPGSHNNGNSNGSNGNGGGNNPGTGGSGSVGKNKPNRIGNNGDGHAIGLSSSTRRDHKIIDLHIARLHLGQLPQHVEPCDTKHHNKGELVDLCIEAELLAYAPKHTFRCPDEMQHDIHIHEDTSKDATLNTKLSKDIAKYVRLCVDAGVL